MLCMVHDDVRQSYHWTQKQTLARTFYRQIIAACATKYMTVILQAIEQS